MKVKFISKHVDERRRTESIKRRATRWLYGGSEEAEAKDLVEGEAKSTDSPWPVLW
jgi:hypothetical protein